MCDNIWTRWSNGQAVDYEKCLCVHPLSHEFIMSEDEFNCHLGNHYKSVIATKESCDDLFCDSANPAGFCWCDPDELNLLLNENNFCNNNNLRFV